jgi:hypothetical protein
MLDYNAIVAQVLALLQQETGAQCDGGIANGHAQESSIEHSSPMLEVYF